MHKLFYELLQVAIGQLDCVERGPSPEEWHELHDMAVRHDLTAVAYRGVEKLFEFGLRAPQDLSIDWMAEAEERPNDYPEPQLPLCQQTAIDDYTGKRKQSARNPLANWQLQRWFAKQTEKTAAATAGNTQDGPEPAMTAFVMLLELQQGFLYSRINLRQLMDLFLVMRKNKGKFAPLPDGMKLEQALRKFGLWRFTQGVMWVMQQTFAMDKKLALGNPQETTGQFILQEVMSDKRHTWQFWRHYPWAMLNSWLG